MELAAYRRTKVKGFRGHKLPKPMNTAWPTGVHEKAGYKFYKACLVGYTQEKMLTKKLDALRQELIAAGLVGAAKLVPSNVEDKSLDAFMTWLCGSACQDDLENMEADEEEPLCARAQEIIDRAMADVLQARGDNESAERNAEATQAKLVVVKQSLLNSMMYC